MGLKFNHLTEEGVKDLLLAVFDKEPYGSKLQELFIFNNQIDEEDLFALKKLCEDKKLKVSIDLFHKFRYLESERLERTIYFYPVKNIDRKAVKEFFEDKMQCGVIVDFRLRTGLKLKNKT